MMKSSDLIAEIRSPENYVSPKILADIREFQEHDFVLVNNKHDAQEVADILSDAGIGAFNEVRLNCAHDCNVSDYEQSDSCSEYGLNRCIHEHTNECYTTRIDPPIRKKRNIRE